MSEFLFLTKKMIGIMLMPLSLVLLLLICSIVVIKWRPHLAIRTLVIGTFLLLTLSLAPVANNLMRPLEQKFTVFNQYSVNPKYIVILGCGHGSSEQLEAIHQLKPCSRERLLEAVRLYQIFPTVTVITSGAAFAELESNATVVKNAAISLGIPENQILTEPFPLDTEEEAQLIAPRIKDDTAILITSASHMKRAIKFFNKYGANPLPAPTGHKVRGDDQFNHWGFWIPTVANLEKSTIAIYEYIGLLWQVIKS